SSLEINIHDIAKNALGSLAGDAGQLSSAHRCAGAMPNLSFATWERQLGHDVAPRIVPVIIESSLRQIVRKQIEPGIGISVSAIAAWPNSGMIHPISGNAVIVIHTVNVQGDAPLPEVRKAVGPFCLRFGPG